MGDDVREVVEGHVNPGILEGVESEASDLGDGPAQAAHENAVVALGDEWHEAIKNHVPAGNLHRHSDHVVLSDS